MLDGFTSSLQAAGLVLNINLSIRITFYNDNSIPLCCSRIINNS